MTGEVYDLKSVKVPRLAGMKLRLFTAYLEQGPGKSLIIEKLMKEAGVETFRSMELDEAPLMSPIVAFGTTHRKDPESMPAESIKSLIDTPEPEGNGHRFPTTMDYHKAYLSGTLSPEDVARRVIKAAEELDRMKPPMRTFIFFNPDDVLEQARESAARYHEGRPLSPFDGVPVAVKDELDMLPFPTTVGTRFLGEKPAAKDAFIVARMRSAGAMMIGKTNMHEIGIGVTGINPHHGPARNPYSPGFCTGGSSSGSAAAVAAGLCPVALGADGGGSIRIPAAFCGVVGLKSTFGRISEIGAYPLCWSVAHVGPIAATAMDAALAYSIIAGIDPADPSSQFQPTPVMDGFGNTNLSGMKIGIFTPWFNHASKGVADACHALADKFQGLGAKIVEIEIPNLDMSRVAHLITIVSEMNASMNAFYEKHRKDFGLDVRANLVLGRSFTTSDYIKAQKMRAKAVKNMYTAFEKADVIITPATGCVAPPILPDAIPDGESDLTVLTEIMRFANLSNLTGFPAISFPAGYEGDLPVGMQAIGKPWEEHTLLRLAHAAETLVERKKPQVFFDLI